MSRAAQRFSRSAKQESDMKVQYQHDQNKKLLEYARADTEYVEQKVSDVSIGGFCMCGSTCATDEVHQKSDKPNHSHVQQDELGKIFSDHIKERTGEEILMLGEQPPELNAVSSKGKLVWVKIATVLDSGACRPEDLERPTSAISGESDMSCVTGPTVATYFYGFLTRWGR